jgi:hypothetical protein
VLEAWIEKLEERENKKCMSSQPTVLLERISLLKCFFCRYHVSSFISMDAFVVQFGDFVNYRDVSWIRNLKRANGGTVKYGCSHYTD